LATRFVIILERQVVHLISLSIGKGVNNMLQKPGIMGSLNGEMTA